MGKMVMAQHPNTMSVSHPKKDRNIVKMVARSWTCWMVKKCRNTTINMLLYFEDALKFACGSECEKDCSLGVSVKGKEGCWNGQKHRVWIGWHTGAEGTGYVWGVCVFCVFLHACKFSVFTYRFLWMKSYLSKGKMCAMLNYSLIFQSCWNKFIQNKRCSRTDYRPGCTASHNPDCGFSGI